MPYTELNAQQISLFSKEVTLAASAGVTVGGNTADFDFTGYHCANLIVDVTAIAGATVGADDITFFLEAKDSVSGKYYTHVTFTVTEAVIPETIVVFCDESTAALPTAPTNFTFQQGHPLSARTYRLRWTVATSGPTWTFSAGIMLKGQ